MRLRFLPSGSSLETEGARFEVSNDSMLVWYAEIPVERLSMHLHLRKTERPQSGLFGVGALVIDVLLREEGE